MSDGDFPEHRRMILAGLQELNAAAKEQAKDQVAFARTTESALAKVTTRLDAIEKWKEEAEKRLRDVESTRSQAIVVAALGSLIVSVVMAALLRGGR